MYQIGFKLETDDETRRDILLEQLIRVLELYKLGGDTVTFVLDRTRITARGKRKITDTVKWEPGEPAPTLPDFGILGSQLDMFRVEPTHGTPLRRRSALRDVVDELTGAIEQRVDDLRDKLTPPATEASPPAPSAAPQLSAIERAFLEAAELGEQLSDDERDDERDDDERD